MSWLGRLRAGLGRSSDKLAQGITGIFTGHRADAVTLEQLEELLIAADLGPSVAAQLAQALAKRRFDKDAGPDAIRTALAEDIAAILAPVAKPLAIDGTHRPHVILVVGVNGSGKTTTIGKLGKALVDDGKSVMLAAGDTFRAAAVEQLQIWGQRIGAPVIARPAGADAAGLAYDALEAARQAGTDVLLIDTAGRLHNKAHLMAELQKVIRVLKKLDPSAPHDVLLVLDATTGQNAHSQVEVFRQMTDVTGLVVTKLDGSARGGVIVGLAGRFGLPINAVGVGESADDLRPFDAGEFARALVGL
jgi:fused signal recognition particle receptor